MAANQKIVELLLKYTTDKNSIGNTIADSKRVQDALAQTAATQKTVVGTSDELDAALARATRARGIDKIADEWRDVYSQTKNADDALAAVERRLRAIGATSDEIDQVASSIANLQDSGGKSVGKQVTAAGRAIFNAPAVGASTPVARGLIAAGGFLDAIGASAAQLAVAAPIAAVAVVGAALALDQFTKSIEASKKTLTSALSAQDVYYTALRDSTSQQVREQIDALSATQRIRGQQRLETQQALDNAFAQAQAAFGDATARALDTAGKLPTAQLRETLAGLDEEFNANEQSIGRLTQGYSANAFAANDAAAAEDELKKARQAAVPIFAAGVQDEIRAQGLTAEERKKAIDQLYLEGAALQQFGMANLDNGEIVDYVNNRIGELNRTGEIYGAVLESIADKEAKLTAIRLAQTDNVSAYFDALKLEGDSQDKLKELLEDYSEASQKAGKAVAKVQTDLASKEADINEKAAADTLKAEEKNAKDREKALKDHNKKLLDIEQSRLEAIGNRDAVALQKSIEAKEKEATDYQDRLTELDAALDEQRKTIQAAQQKAQQDAQDAARKSIQDLRDKWKEEESDRQQAIAVARNTLHNAEVAAQLTQDQVYADEQQAAARAAVISIEAAYQTGISQGAAYVAGLNTGAFTASASARPAPFPSTVNNTPFPVRTEGASLSPTRGGGLSIPITVNGSSKQQILTAVWNDLDAALTGEGY